MSKRVGVGGIWLHADLVKGYRAAKAMEWIQEA